MKSENSHCGFSFCRDLDSNEAACLCTLLVDQGAATVPVELLSKDPLIEEYFSFGE